MPTVGRRRTLDLDLPPLMFRRGERYYFGQQGLALGTDLRQALLKYAELRTGKPQLGTFADATAAYLRSDAFKTKAPKTQAEYSRQMVVLAKVFGNVPLEQIRPAHIRRYMDARKGKISATREKALFSIVFNFARANDLTTAANPCVGILGRKSARGRLLSDAEFAAAVSAAPPVVAGFLELSYRTGQRPSDVLRMTRADIADGFLSVRQAKTGTPVRITVQGPLQALVDRLLAGTVGNVRLIRDEKSQPMTLGAIRRRFWKLKAGWQIRDLRAKALTDIPELRDAQRLAGHTMESTTALYRRKRVGEVATPVMKEIKE